MNKLKIAVVETMYFKDSDPTSATAAFESHNGGDD